MKAEEYEPNSCRKRHDENKNINDAVAYCCYLSYSNFTHTFAIPSVCFKSQRLNIYRVEMRSDDMRIQGGDTE